ncbi:small multidrug efflux protein [Isoptericola sp. NPDC056605]|uniref:small multidrug efflux protein n=1 Tax=Isoptericola sp. NPDC056605 TaxID=3345876 RepID=UPI0036CCFEA8
MNLVDTFQDLVAQVPDLVQPLIVAVAAMVPFIEGEGGATIGIIGGIHPAVAAVAAMLGNFLAVTAVVLASAGARDAVVNRRRAKARQSSPVPVGSGPAPGGKGALGPAEDRRDARRAKFQRAYERYGVPGVSLLGPLLLPTHFTASMLVASGVGKARVLVWQAVAIVGWTTVTAFVASRLLNLVSGTAA